MVVPQRRGRPPHVVHLLTQGFFNQHCSPLHAVMLHCVRSNHRLSGKVIYHQMLTPNNKQAWHCLPSVSMCTSPLVSLLLCLLSECQVQNTEYRREDFLDNFPEALAAFSHGSLAAICLWRPLQNYWTQTWQADVPGHVVVPLLKWRDDWCDSNVDMNKRINYIQYLLKIVPHAVRSLEDASVWLAVKLCVWGWGVGGWGVLGLPHTSVNT